MTLTLGFGPDDRVVIEGTIRGHQVITVYDSTGMTPLYRVHTIAVEVPPDDPLPDEHPTAGAS